MYLSYWKAFALMSPAISWTIFSVIIDCAVSSRRRFGLRRPILFTSSSSLLFRSFSVSSFATSYQFRWCHNYILIENNIHIIELGYSLEIRSLIVPGRSIFCFKTRSVRIRSFLDHSFETYQQEDYKSLFCLTNESLLWNGCRVYHWEVRKWKYFP